MAAGAISVVAPIAGVSAVIPVLFGVAAGDALGPLRAAGIGAALAGVALASRERAAARFGLAAGVGWALLAALGFGFYYPPLHAAGELDPYWAVLVFRFTSVPLVTAALLADPRAPAGAAPTCRSSRSPGSSTSAATCSTRSRPPSTA